MLKQILKVVRLMSVGALLAGLLLLLPKPAAAANPNLINFQGKVVNADGTNVTNGNYSFRFRLYTSTAPTDAGNTCSANSCKWEETKTVTVTNGVFQTELGDTTTMIDVSAYTDLYLGVKFNNDAQGEMSPRIHLDSAPYALNADKLGGLSSSAFAQLGSANAFTNSNSITTASATAFQVINGSSKEIFTVDTSGNQLRVGAPGTSGVTGKISFNNSSNGNTAAIQSGTTSSSYALTLPTALPGSSQCLQSDSGGALSFTACGGSIAADSLDFSDLKDALTLDAATSVGFGGASNYGLTFNDDGSSNYSVNLSSTGDFVIQDNGTPALTVNDDGSSVFSGPGITVQRTDGTEILAVDTVNSTIKLLPSNQTFTSAPSAALQLVNTYTSDFAAGAVPAFIDSHGIFVANQSLNPFFGGALFWARNTLTNTSGVTANLGPYYSLLDQNIYQADAASISLNSTTSLQIAPTFKSINSGALAVTNFTGLNVTPNVNAGATLTNYTGVMISQVGGAGTVTNQIGLDVSGMNQGTSSNIGVRIGEPTGSATTKYALQLSGTSGASSGGITFGTDTNLYRSAASTLKTDDDLLVQTASNSLNALAVMNSGGVNVSNVSTSTTANLISNPSFENNIDGWSPKGAPSAFAWDNFANNAQYGEATLKATVNSTSDGAQFNVPLKPNTTYSFRFWAKVSSGTLSAIAGRQENGSNVETSCSSFTVTTSWAEYNCDNFTTGSLINSSTTNVYIRESSGPVSTTLFLDGVVLVQGATGLDFDGGGANFNLDSLNSNVTFNATNTGDIQAWQQNANGLAANREAGAAVTANGYIYDIGGFDGTSRQNSVMYANLNADGSTGTWGTTTAITNNSVAQNRQYPAAAAANGYIYVIGGFDGTQANSSIFYGKLNSDGTVGTWYCQGVVSAAGCGSSGLPVNSNGLPAARVAAAAVVSNGYIYVLGGCSDSTATCGTPQSTVYYAKLQADGSTGPWTTSANTLSQARGMLTAAFENGYLIAMGGHNSTSVTTVDKAQVASGGDITSSFSTSGMKQLPTSLQEHTSAIINGYVYVIGGSDGAASPSRQTPVYYSHLSSGGANGVWQTASNPLPTPGRSGQSTAVVNGYIYVLGGCGSGTAGACGSGQTSSVFYASTARVLIGGTLDLVGLTSQSLNDAGGAGLLTAGSGRFVGDLKVDGYADFNNGLSVDSGLDINAVSATAGQTVFNINNSSANSIFSVRHMGTNFGSLVKAGAFEGRNSYFGEEFNISPLNASQTCLANATETNIGWSRGDMGSHNNAAVTCGTSADQFSGEFNWSTKNGSTTASQGCTVAYQNGGTANGVERISATSTNTANNSASCLEALAATRTTSNKIYAAANLPVASFKVKASTLTASQNTDRVRIGLSDINTASTTGAPTNGIFFSNCSTENTATASVSGCSNTTWYGHVMAGGPGEAATSVTCSGGSSITSNFSYLRIEVRATNDIHFYADYNTADGINETECGSGITATAASAAMTVWSQSMVATNSARTAALDVDYIRTWQDDNVEPPADAQSTTPDNQPIVSTAPLTVTTPGTDDSNFFSFNAATSEDMTFNQNVYVKGTLFADKIKANQIEGLEVLTDKIGSLQQQLAKDQNATPTTTPTATQPAVATSGLAPDSQVVNLVALAQIESQGGLVVDKTAQFNGKTIFQLLADFNGAANFHDQVNFDKQPTFNSDAGGTTVIKQGAQRVDIKFTTAYTQTPIVLANRSLDTDDQAAQDAFFKSDYRYIVAKISSGGFTIVLDKPAAADMKFTWIATAVKDAKISESQPLAQ